VLRRFVRHRSALQLSAPINHPRFAPSNPDTHEIVEPAPRILAASGPFGRRLKNEPHPKEPGMSNTLPPSKMPSASRRGFLGGAGVSVAGLALAGAMGRPHPALAATQYSDTDILNFALNLEYLEAEYYLRGYQGSGIPSQYTGGVGTFGGVVSTPPTPRVRFMNKYVQNYAEELATDELNHVIFLREQLGSAAIAEPQINIGTAFDAFAQAAGIGSSFDPYSSETNFLIGGYIFEDVGVTAYNGAAPLISDKTLLSYASGILGTEGYHAAGLRAYLTRMEEDTPSLGIFRTCDLISDLRDHLDGPGQDDEGLLVRNLIDIVPNNYTTGLVFARTFTQVLAIVYGNTAATPGGFIPSGVNGVIQ
jgi:hypothetical protein